MTRPVSYSKYILTCSTRHRTKTIYNIAQHKEIDEVKWCLPYHFDFCRIVSTAKEHSMHDPRTLTSRVSEKICRRSTYDASQNGEKINEKSLLLSDKLFYRWLIIRDDGRWLRACSLLCCCDFGHVVLCTECMHGTSYRRLLHKKSWE